MAKVLRCPLCSTELALALPIARHACCDGCGNEMHACHACKLHDPTAHNQCREARAEWQSRRDRGNFCDFFELAAPGSADASDDTKESQRQQALDDLFKNF